jgi:hypothetical protein
MTKLFPGQDLSAHLARLADSAPATLSISFLRENAYNESIAFIYTVGHIFMRDR